MPTFEEGFATAESAADSVLKALNEAAGIARQLRKASQDGNIAAVRRQSERLDGAVNLIRQEVVNASTAWPFTAEDERRYLEEGYGRELQAEAEKRGLQVFERDGRLIAHPSMVRVLPGERAVRIDRRQSSAVRPSRVVGDLAKLQNNPSRFRPQPFLEALYEAYLALAQSDTADRLKLGQVGQVIRLESIYKLFTGLPGSSRDSTVSWISPGTSMRCRKAAPGKSGRGPGCHSLPPPAPGALGGRFRSSDPAARPCFSTGFSLREAAIDQHSSLAGMA